MKKLTLAAMMAMSMCAGILATAAQAMPAKAVGDFTFGIEQLTLSTFYDFKAADLYWGGITSVLDYKNLVSLDVGLITSAEKVAMLAGLGVNIGEVLTYFPGFNLGTVLENTRVGGFMAKHIEATRTIDMYGIYVGMYINFGD